MAKAKLTAARLTTFLRVLAATGNVAAAARAIGVSRWTCYRQRRADPAFAEAWRDAEEDAVDLLEAEARRRALEGVERPLVGGGKLIKDDDGQVVMVRDYNDRLLEFLLKAHRPEKYRDKSEAAAAPGRGGRRDMPAVRVVIEAEGGDAGTEAASETGTGADHDGD